MLLYHIFRHYIEDFPLMAGLKTASRPAFEVIAGGAALGHLSMV